MPPTKTKPVKTKLTISQVWKLLIEDYKILDEINKKGLFYIKAKQIGDYKEARLMAKFDSSDSLPIIFKNAKINILPISRNSYVLSDFILYQKIPELDEHVTKMTYVEFPEYESIDVNKINSEANAINALIILEILDDFLASTKNISTFNGRMGTGSFNFKVDTYRGIKREIQVNNAQCEIDGGFENDSSVVIMEAKNVVHEDFHIRQLYYPYRLWEKKVNKPIRLVFSIYSNKIFRLFEYRFKTLDDFSSIELVQMKNYSLQDITITFEDLVNVRKSTKIMTNDDMSSAKIKIPFIQANSMDRIISLLENMYNNPMTSQQIAELMKFEPRQSDYYYNAGRYLGLFEKNKENGQTVVSLTVLGVQVFHLNYKDRQLKLVELILEHQIFADFFDQIVETGELPDINNIEEKMRKYNVCDEGQINRRAGSVLGWLKWMITLTKL